MIGGLSSIAFVATFFVLNTSLEEKWTVFVDPGGAFEVAMPDSVKTETKLVQTAIGQLLYISHTSADVQDSVTIRYALNYCDYPQGTFHPDSLELIDLFYQETIASSLESVNGTLIYSDINDIAGRYQCIWKIASEEHEVHIKSQALIEGDRYYNLQVVTPADHSLLDESGRFFGSFKLLK